MPTISSLTYGISAFAGRAPETNACQHQEERPDSHCPQHMKPYLGVTLSALSQMEEGWASVGGSHPHKAGGQGLFGSNVMSGLFGADSPFLNLIHGVLDPIPVVGELANKLCGVVSPGYHQAHEQELAQRHSASASASLAVSYQSSAGQNPAT